MIQWPHRYRLVVVTLSVLLTIGTVQGVASGAERADSAARKACRPVGELLEAARTDGTLNGAEERELKRILKNLRRSHTSGASALGKRFEDRISATVQKQRSALREIKDWCEKHEAPTFTTISQTELNEIMARVFENYRQSVVDAAVVDPQIEALRDFSYDIETNVVHMDLLSAFQGPDLFRSLFDQQAWDLTSAFSTWFWSSTVLDTIEVRGGTIAMLPTWHMRLEDVLEYECSPDVMVAFAAKQLGMQDFLAQCVRA